MLHALVMQTEKGYLQYLVLEQATTIPLPDLQISTEMQKQVQHHLGLGVDKQNAMEVKLRSPNINGGKKKKTSMAHNKNQLHFIDDVTDDGTVFKSKKLAIS